MIAELVALSSLIAPAQQDLERRVPTLVLTGENEGRDWRWTSTFLRGLLEDSGKFDVEITLYPDGALVDAGYLERFELVVVDYAGKRWGAEAEARFASAVKAGTDVLVLGTSSGAFRGWKEYPKIVGHVWRGGESPRTAFDVTVLDAGHPITAGLGAIRAHTDVLLHGFESRPGKHEVLAVARTDELESDAPILIAGKYGDGRVAQVLLGHVAPGDRESWASMQDPQVQELMLRSAEWAATGKVTPRRRIEPNTLSAADRAAGWRLLFDGTTTSGWKTLGGGLPEERWRVDGGALRLLPAGEDEEGGEFVFEEVFDEFELEAEWRVEGGGDPGVLQRLDAVEEGALAFETGDADPNLRVLRPAGEYNHARVVARRDRVEHWLNGIHLLTFDMSSGQWAEMVRGRNLRENLEAKTGLEQLPLGRIALRGGGTDVWLRNIKIRRLPETVVSTQPALEGPGLFNGRDLTGWTWVPERARSESAFSVREGVIHCAGTPTGYLRSDAAYQDYVLELEWRFTRRSGEAGVLFHVTGEDEIWPRSIEVQLMQHYAGDIRAWGDLETRETRRQVNAVVRRRGGDEHRPTEWNHLEVRHVGGTFTVRLNGRIVNVLTEIEPAAGFFAIKAEGGELELRGLRLTR